MKFVDISLKKIALVIIRVFLVDKALFIQLLRIFTLTSFLLFLFKNVLQLYCWYVNDDVFFFWHLGYK